MKKVLLTLALVTVFGFAQAEEYKVITVVESIVPGGLGRSRIIENKTDINADDFTTERTNGKKSEQGKIKRGDAKIDQFSETKILNFFSKVGINFQNIASNDAIVTSKINNLTKQGWTLVNVFGGVESHAGKDDRGGIFITRYLFKK